VSQLGQVRELRTLLSSLIAFGTRRGIAAAVVLLVTVLSLPPLLRLMRPDGLRTG
jgi:hypothetical protein